MTFSRLVDPFLKCIGYTIKPVNRHQVFPSELQNSDSYAQPADFSRLYRPWTTANYEDILTPAVLRNTMLSRLKLYFLTGLLSQISHLPGDILEAGCGSGGSTRAIANVLKKQRRIKPLWILDTFAGYDNVDEKKDGTHVHTGDCKCASKEEVRQLLSDYDGCTHLIEGSIPTTLQHVAAKSLAFAHIDVNLYEPTKEATRFCLEKMSVGGIILFDDYGWPATFGAKAAIDEVVSSFGLSVLCIPESTQAFLIAR